MNVNIEKGPGPSVVDQAPGVGRDDLLCVRVSPDMCPSVHSFGNKIGRLMWGIVWTLLFRPSPRAMGGWRRLLLRCFGARIGKGARILSSARIWAPWNLEMGDYACLSEFADCYCVAPVSIGAHATVSQYAFLCTASHDIHDPNMGLVTGPIKVGAGAWVCAGAFVGMGVTIGEGAVTAARSVVVKDVAPWAVVGGNPARFIKPRVLTVKS